MVVLVVRGSTPRVKVIIAGSRSINEPELIEMAVAESGFDVTEVVSGCAKDGIDRLGIEWAEKNGLPVEPFPANWADLSHPDALIKTNKWGQKYDAKAGFRRNETMAVYADALIAIWDGKSKGTKHMLKMARKRELPTFVYRTDLPFKTGHVKQETKREFYARLSKLANDHGW